MADNKNDIIKTIPCWLLRYTMSCICSSTEQHTIDLISDFYCEDEILTAKKLLCEQFTVPYITRSSFWEAKT